MRRRLVFAAVALLAFAAGVSLPSARADHSPVQEEIESQTGAGFEAIGVPERSLPPCPSYITAPPAEGAGYLVVTAEPRMQGVRIDVDGARHVTDANGCLILETRQGTHLVRLPTDDSGEFRQRLGGKVREVTGRFDTVVILEGPLLELQVDVGDPVCELRPPRRPEGTDALPRDAEAGLLIIATVPRTEGVLVNIDGNPIFSDEDGCIVAEVERGSHEIAVPELYEVDDTTRFVFGRWDDIWQNVRTETFRASPIEMQLGIKIQHPVRFEFFDATFAPFDRSRIQVARLVNSFGEEFPLSEHSLEDDEVVDFDRVWMTKNRLRRVSVGLFSDDNIYVFREVMVDGQNVIQSGEIDYIPSLSPNCPEVSTLEPQRCNTWRTALLLFPFQVELRSFIFRAPVDAEVEVFLLDGPETGEPVLVNQTDEEGWVTWPQVPRGDYEIRVKAGGITTAAPTIVTGPKVERITVMTSDVLWFVGPVLFLMLVTAVLFILKPRWRLALAALWPLVFGFVLSVPTLGAAFSRPLSASVRPIYTAEGAFVGLDARVMNAGAIPIDQSYCAPDFELRIPFETGIWRATFESHDFHDVETSPFCRIHRIDPGANRHYFSSTVEQEWVLEGVPPPPGIYEAFVRIFDVPAGTVNLDLRHGFAPYLSFAQPEEFEEDKPFFTNFFED